MDDLDPNAVTAKFKELVGGLILQIAQYELRFEQQQAELVRLQQALAQKSGDPS